MEESRSIFIFRQTSINLQLRVSIAPIRLIDRLIIRLFRNSTILDYRKAGKRVTFRKQIDGNVTVDRF